MARDHESFETRMQRVDAALALVRAEIERAALKHPPFNSRHEGYSVLLEEVDELWDDVKADRHHPAIIEAIQVAAMGVRFISDLGTWETAATFGSGETKTTHTLRDPAIVADQKAARDRATAADVTAMLDDLGMGRESDGWQHAYDLLKSFAERR